jgi:hypothetical protein
MGTKRQPGASSYTGKCLSLSTPMTWSKLSSRPLRAVPLVEKVTWILVYSFCSSSMLVINKLAVQYTPLPTVVSGAQLAVSALVVAGPESPPHAVQLEPSPTLWTWP